MKINKSVFYLPALLTIVTCTAAGARAQTSSGPQRPAHGDGTSHPCPLMPDGEKSKAGGKPDDGHAGHLAAVNARGEQAMGFSQTATTHHFILNRRGGFIQVEANDADDIANRDSIRQHLAAIARAFAVGDFATPQNVHRQVPPGVTEMRRLRSAIEYKFEELERGGRVRIATHNSDARAAVHRFLRFQIEDHQTGDSLEVKD